MSETGISQKTDGLSPQSDYVLAESMLLASVARGSEEVANRATLGSRIPIQLFQALRLIALGSSIEEMVGGGSRALVYRSGQHLGDSLGRMILPQAGNDLKKYLGLCRDVLEKLSVGLVVADKIDLAEGRLVLRVDECVSCAGIANASAPICHFEAGMVGGIVRTFTGTEVRAVETRCNAVGDCTCSIDVQIIGT